MAFSVARPLDIMVGYDPGVVSLRDQAHPLEVQSPAGYPEMTGGADTYYEDFTSGLRDFVAARAGAAEAADGPTLVGGWFGGGGADPSALVLGVDWLADEGLADEGPADEPQRSREAPPDRASAPNDGGLLSFVVDSSDTGEPEPPDNGRAEAVNGGRAVQSAARSNNIGDARGDARAISAFIVPRIAGSPAWDLELGRSAGVGLTPLAGPD